MCFKERGKTEVGNSQRDATAAGTAVPGVPAPQGSGGRTQSRGRAPAGRDASYRAAGRGAGDGTEDLERVQRARVPDRPGFAANRDEATATPGAREGPQRDRSQAGQAQAGSGSAARQGRHVQDHSGTGQPSQRESWFLIRFRNLFSPFQRDSYFWKL